MSIVLRAAQGQDALATGTILADFIQETDWLPNHFVQDETQKYCAMMIDRGWMQVAELDDQVIGFLAKDQGYIHALYVRASMRGSRVGHQLVRAAQMQEVALDLWTYQANHAARRFYLKEGFQETDRSGGANNDEGLPDIRFQWQRNAA